MKERMPSLCRSRVKGLGDVFIGEYSYKTGCITYNSFDHRCTFGTDRLPYKNPKSIYNWTANSVVKRLTISSIINTCPLYYLTISCEECSTNGELGVWAVRAFLGWMYQYVLRAQHLSQTYL